MNKKDLLKQWLRVKYDKFAQAEKTPKRIVKWIIWCILAVVATGAVGMAIVVMIIFPSLPDINNIQNLVAAQSSTIYDREGNLLYTIHGEENRENVRLADISPQAVQAVLSIEDDQFYNHGGVDFSAILKAICSEIHLCPTARGGSTITQQFIKNAFLTNERTYTRKLKEILLALELESKFTKDQILEMYLNRIPYGSSIYGIERASRTFFGKPAKELTLAEGAVLASIPKAPSFFSPYGNNKYASINISEDDILKTKIKSEQDLIDVNPDFVIKGLLGKTYYFGVTDVQAPDTTGDAKTDDKKDVKNDIGKTEDVKTSETDVSGTANVEPPKNYDRKIYVKGRVDYVLGRMRDLGFIAQEEFDSAIAESEKIVFKPYVEEIKAPHFVMYVRQILEEKYGKEQVEKGGLKITTTIDPKLQEAAEKAVTENAENNLKKYGANNASLVASDPNNGQILAMVGSVDYWNDEIDGKVNVALRPRLPGSSFKPIVYATAFLQGFAPSTVVYDVETNFGGTYKPKNYDGTFSGPTTFRRALGHSLNIPAIKAAYLAGVPNVLDLARKMGIQLNQPEDWYGLSLAIGAGEARLLDMVGAYSIFANGGYKMDPISVLKVEDRNGNILEEYQSPQNRVLILDPQVAYLVNNVLSDPESRPEGWWRSRLTIPGQINGAKTGTSNKEIKNVDYPFDTWCMGYTRRIASGVWVGNNDGAVLKQGADGLETAALIWHQFMVEATKGLPREDFERPEGIKWIKVSKKTGKLPSEYTPPEEVKTEVFASFSIPQEYDTSYKMVKLDKVSGKLATEFTPEAAIEEKAFFEHHSEFPDNPIWEAPVRKWAEDNKQDEVAPTEFDDVHTADTVDTKPNIIIKTPGSMDTVSPPNVGVWVDIQSKGGVNYVEYYWDDTLVDTVKTSPYKGSLTITKEANANGSTHTIKAIVYDSLFRSNQSSIDVKIGSDTIPPQIEFAYPGDGIRLSAGSSMATQVNASDTNGDIKKVEFYLDGELEFTAKQPPYVWQFTVPATLGTHDIEATAYDFSDNKAQTKIQIIATEGETQEQTDSSRITEPYKNQSFSEGDRILIQVAMSDESQANLKELVVTAKPKDGKTIEIARAQGDPKKGGAYSYTFIWDKVTAGTYDLSLKIVLQDGKIRFSGKVPIVVR